MSAHNDLLLICGKTGAACGDGFIQEEASLMLGNPSEPTIWEAKGEPLANIGGWGAPSYRLTPWYLYWERGVVTTNSQQVALIYVFDVDVKQSMTQKARHVGDVVVHAGAQSVTVESIREPRWVRDTILAAVQNLRHATVAEVNTYTQRTDYRPPPPTAPPTAPASPPGGDVMALLRQLGDLRDAGVVSPEEFEAKKAELLGRL